MRLGKKNRNAGWLDLPKMRRFGKPVGFLDKRCGAIESFLLTIDAQMGAHLGRPDLAYLIGRLGCGPGILDRLLSLGSIFHPTLEGWVKDAFFVEPEEVRPHDVHGRLSALVFFLKRLGCGNQAIALAVGLDIPEPAHRSAVVLVRRGLLVFSAISDGTKS